MPIVEAAVAAELAEDSLMTESVDEPAAALFRTPLFRAEQGATMSLARLGGRRQETSAALGGADQVTVGIGPGGS